LRSTGDVKQSNLIRQPDGSVAFLIDFEGPVLKSLLEDAKVRSQVSVGDNADLLENSVRYNPVTQGWRLTLRVKVKDTSKSVEMRAALVQDALPGDATDEAAKTELAKGAKSKPAAKPAETAADADAGKDKAVAKADKPAEGKDAKGADAGKPVEANAQQDTAAVPTTPEPIKTEQVLTETWSYQLPADE
jgi:glucans biosynthesis protein